MPKKTILHIPSWYPNKDDVQLGIFIENQIELLNEDVNNIVLYLQGRKESKIIESSISVKNKVTRIIVTYPAGKNIFSKTRNFLNSVTTGLAKLIELNQKIDLVHCHVAGKNLWIAQKYFKELPCLLSEHWSGFLNGNFELQPQWKQKITLKRMNKCAAIFTVSEQLKSALTTLPLTLPIEVIGNVISASTPKEAIQKNSFKLLVVCDLIDTVKNIRGMITAFEKVKLKQPEATLTIIGDGADYELISDQIQALNLTNFVFLMGRLSQEEVLSHYEKYDVLIVNSWVETFSMVTLEALSTGLPVIATKCHGPEQFITSENGLLIPLNEPKALVEALEQIARNIEKYPPEKIRKSVEKWTNPELIKQAIFTQYNYFTNN